MDSYEISIVMYKLEGKKLTFYSEYKDFTTDLELSLIQIHNHADLVGVKDINESKFNIYKFMPEG
jgi:hypothetical protein